MSIRFSRTAAVLLSWASIVAAQDNAAPDQAKPAQPSRSELRDKQLDVSLEARDIERILAKLKKASDLSKERITEAAVASEGVSSLLERGDSQAAKTNAEQAAAMFQEIAKQLEALLAEETPQRIAAARNLAAQLSRTERQFAQQIQGMRNPPQAGGAGKVDPKSEVKPMSGPPNPQAQGSGQKPNPDNKTGAGGGEKKPDDDMPQDGQSGGKPKDKDDPKNENISGGAGDKPMPDGKEPQPGTGKTEATDKGKEGQDGSGTAKEKADEPTKPGAGTGDAKDEAANEKPPGAGRGKARPMTDEERRDALARRAAELAEKGETLLDVLQAIAASTEPADQEAVAKVNALLKETNLADAVAAMKEAAAQIQANRLDDAKLSAMDIADRMEITAQRLDAAYRTIVAPQAEELRKLEQQLAQLGLKLEDLQTQSQIAAWHREARELLDRAEGLGVSETVRDALLEEMQKAGLGVGGERNRFDWGLANGRYAAPAAYTVRLIELQEEVQMRIQGLLLGDIVSAADDATPPKYQGLVERYYQVLSRDGGDKSSKVFRTPPVSKKGTP